MKDRWVFSWWDDALLFANGEAVETGVRRSVRRRRSDGCWVVRIAGPRLEVVS